ncbi:hypothetical protein FRB90_000090 [Tulasnella sp. 427]|nr:hypothetical protein FRB90_000090 [Tulasnella sp. 427]
MPITVGQQPNDDTSSDYESIPYPFGKSASPPSLHHGTSQGGTSDLREILEILRAQITLMDQVREVIRYLGDLNMWLDRDALDRQLDMTTLAARLDYLRDELDQRQPEPMAAPPLFTDQSLINSFQDVENRNLQDPRQEHQSLRGFSWRDPPGRLASSTPKFEIGRTSSAEVVFPIDSIKSSARVPSTALPRAIETGSNMQGKFPFFPYHGIMAPPLEDIPQHYISSSHELSALQNAIPSVNFNPGPAPTSGANDRTSFEPAGHFPDVPHVTQVENPRTRLHKSLPAPPTQNIAERAAISGGAQTSDPSFVYHSRSRSRHAPSVPAHSETSLTSRKWPIDLVEPWSYAPKEFRPPSQAGTVTSLSGYASSGLEREFNTSHTIFDPVSDSDSSIYSPVGQSSVLPGVTEEEPKVGNNLPRSQGSDGPDLAPGRESLYDYPERASSSLSEISLVRRRGSESDSDDGVPDSRAIYQPRNRSALDSIPEGSESDPDSPRPGSPQLRPSVIEPHPPSRSPVRSRSRSRSRSPARYIREIVDANELREIINLIRGNDSIQVLILEQVRELIRYLGELHSWLDRDANNRQLDMTTLTARLDYLRDELDRYTETRPESMAIPTSYTVASRVQTHYGQRERRTSIEKSTSFSWKNPTAKVSTSAVSVPHVKNELLSVPPVAPSAEDSYLLAALPPSGFSTTHPEAPRRNLSRPAFPPAHNILIPPEEDIPQHYMIIPKDFRTLKDDGPLPSMNPGASHWSSSLPTDPFPNVPHVTLVGNGQTQLHAPFPTLGDQKTTKPTTSRGVRTAASWYGNSRRRSHPTESESSYIEPERVASSAEPWSHAPREFRPPSRAGSSTTGYASTGFDRDFKTTQTIFEPVSDSGSSIYCLSPSRNLSALGGDGEEETSQTAAGDNDPACVTLNTPPPPRSPTADTSTLAEYLEVFHEYSEKSPTPLGDMSLLRRRDWGNDIEDGVSDSHPVLRRNTSTLSVIPEQSDSDPVSPLRSPIVRSQESEEPPTKNSTFSDLVLSHRPTPSDISLMDSVTFRSRPDGVSAATTSVGSSSERSDLDDRLPSVSSRSSAFTLIVGRTSPPGISFIPSAAEEHSHATSESGPDRQPSLSLPPRPRYTSGVGSSGSRPLPAIPPDDNLELVEFE